MGSMDICRELGDDTALAYAMTQTANVQLQRGANDEAMKMAQSALDIFNAAGNKAGESEVNDVLTGIYIAQGNPGKAPNKGKAKNTLKELCKAVTDKDKAAFTKAYDKVAKYEAIISNEEFWSALQPAFVKDQEGTEEFMKDQGYKMSSGEVARTGDANSLGRGRSFDHILFYANSRTGGGMGFGPQFRSVHPFRYGTPGVDGSACCAAHLPETEDWELKLGFRPGILDSALQQLGVLGMP